MMKENKNKIENRLDTAENNFGKNSFADVASAEPIKSNDDLAWSRFMEGGLLMMDQDLEEIQSGEIIAKNREIYPGERDTFWQELDSVANQETKSENIETGLSVARRGELIKNELQTNIERDKTRLMSLKNQVTDLKKQREKVRRRDWKNYVPVYNVVYSAMSKPKLKEISQQISKCNDEISIIESQQYKNREAIKKIDAFYNKNKPEKLFYCKAKKEIEETMTKVIKTIEKKYENKITPENKRFWNLTKLNFKQEVLAEVGSKLLDNELWEGKYRAQLELLLKEKEAELGREKITKDEHQYDTDPQEWSFGQRAFFTQPNKITGSERVDDWDWQEYKDTFVSSEFLSRINIRLERQMAKYMVDYQWGCTDTPEIIAKLVKPEELLPYVFRKMQILKSEGNNIFSYLDYFRMMKFDPNIERDFYKKIDPMATTLEIPDRKQMSFRGDQGPGFVLKHNPDYELTDDETNLLKIYFDPNSMFSKLLNNLKEKSKTEPYENKKEIEHFFQMSAPTIMRQEKYSKQLLEKKLATVDSLKRFYFIDGISDIHGIAEYVFPLAEGDKKIGEKIWNDFKDDFIGKAVVGEGTKKAWNIIHKNTNFSKEEIWQMFAPTLEKYPKPSIEPLQSMAKDGYLEEKEIVGKFGKEIISGLSWDNASVTIEKINKLKDTNKEELQNLFYKLFDHLCYHRSGVEFETQIDSLEQLINMTKVDGKIIYQKYLPILLESTEQNNKNILAHTRFLSLKSGVDLEKIRFQLLSQKDEKQKLKENKIIDFLVRIEKQKYLEEYIGRLAYLFDNQNIGQISNEQKEQIQYFLKKINPNDKRDFVEQITKLNQLKTGKKIIRLLVDNAKIEKNFIPSALKSIVNLAELAEKLGWGVDLNIKEPSWQKISNHFKKQLLKEMQERSDSYQFIGYANRASYQEVFGKNVITDLLNSMNPTADGQYSSEKRNALTHNKYDRFSEWLKYNNQRFDLTLNETNFKLCGDFIRSYGLTKDECLFGYYRDLWLKKNNKADEVVLERIKSSGLKDLNDLKLAVEKISKNLVADIFELDFKTLTNFDKALLDSQLGISRHTHGGTKDINWLIATYLSDKEEIDKTITPPEYKIWEMEVKNLGSSFDYPDNERKEYQKIVDQIRNYRNNNWQEQIKNLSKQDFGDNGEKAIGWVFDNQERLTAEETKKCGNIIKAFIWQRILKQDLVTEERQIEWLKSINSPEQVEVLQTFITTNILEHGIAGHENSLQEIWGKTLTDIINREKTKEWLTNLFTEEKNKIEGLNHSWQNTRKTSGVAKIKMIPGRDFIGSASAYIANACYSKETSFIKKYDGKTLPMVIPYRLTKDQEIMGSVLLFELKNDNALLVRAFNIPNENDFDVAEVIEKFLDEAQKIAKGRGLEKVIVPAGSDSAISNYGGIKNYIETTYKIKENKIELKQEFDFNGYPLKNACYIAREIKL